jgi:hypothetical protein
MAMAILIIGVLGGLRQRVATTVADQERISERSGTLFLSFLKSQ